MENIELNESKDKNEYEERIRRFADALDSKITFLKSKASEIEESASASYNSKVQFLGEKKDQIEEKLQSIKNSSQEQWNSTYESVSNELKAISKETGEAYTGIKNGFSYLFEKLASK